MRFMQVACISLISANAMEANQHVLEGIHSKSYVLVFPSPWMGDGKMKPMLGGQMKPMLCHGLHLTTRLPGQMSDTHCIAGQISHEVRIASPKFLLLCSVYTSWKNAKSFHIETSLV